LSEVVAALAWALGRRELDDAAARFAKEGRSELTRLRTELDGVDPDIAFSIVPYEKGALFLWSIELAVGRSAESRGLAREWFARFAPRYHPIAREVVQHVLALADAWRPDRMLSSVWQSVNPPSTWYLSSTDRNWSTPWIRP
jgi:hypothetical protein